MMTPEDEETPLRTRKPLVGALGTAATKKRRKGRGLKKTRPSKKTAKKSATKKPKK